MNSVYIILIYFTGAILLALFRANLRSSAIANGLLIIGALITGSLSVNAAWPGGVREELLLSRMARVTTLTCALVLSE